ncbi:hypothetical protein SDC9_83489 [bioreactor metagenome]|uniref:Uncharacterized protein n=1 Tax=bioreactor metagenome TaxID=1076179 RepID=A0A644Z7P1_9ZZZZ
MRIRIFELETGGAIRETCHRSSGRGSVRVFTPATEAAGEPDAVYLLAETGRTVCYEITLPAKTGRRATEEILYNELSERLPVEPESVRWFYRPDGGNRFQVCAVQHSEIDRVLAVAAQHALKFDRLVPAALAKTPEELLRVVAPEPLPEEFRPVRFRRWKVAYALLLLLLLSLLIPMFAGKYRAFSVEHRKLTAVRESLSSALRKERSEYGRLSADRELLEEIRNARIGWDGIAPALGVLTKRLPPSMWVSGLAANDRMVDLTVSAAEDDANFYKTIGDSDYYSIVSLRKSREADRRTLFMVKLRGNQID